MIGSVPMALLGPHLVAWFTDDTEELDHVLMISIGFALLLAAATYALRLYINLRRVRSGHPRHDENPPSGPCRRCSSARSAACWSASPASAPARSS